MKPFAALLIGLSAGVLSAAAVAEPFNDRSPQPTVAESTVTPVEPRVVMAPSDHFNDRGVDYTVAQPGMLSLLPIPLSPPPLPWAC